MTENAKVIIDEARIKYNNRNYKFFPLESIYFYKYHRHYKVSVDVLSKSYEDMDVTLHHLAQNFYVVRRSLVPFCVVARRIQRKMGVDEQTKQIADLYAMGLPLLDTKRIFSPPLWKLFNSYSWKELAQKVRVFESLPKIQLGLFHCNIFSRRCGVHRDWPRE